jgi:2-succinyl-6-hydroxy-2,4-cyclohexadiene-1-carboxylate synthase
MPFVDVPNARLWYTDSGGGGQPVVFVHPAAATSDGWLYQIDAFVDAGYRCVTYDLRGWGKSQPTDSTADPGIASDDLQALVDALGLPRFNLIAAAYGGFCGLDYALRFQERLQAFVLATSQGGLVDQQVIAMRDRAVTPQIRALPIDQRELGPSYRAENPEGVALWLDIVRAGAPEGTRRQEMALGITLPMLESLRVPTLVVAAGADLLAPPALMRLFVNRLHGLFTIINDAGHSAHWERPERWNERVLEFLAMN